MKRNILIALGAILVLTVVWSVSEVDARRGKQGHRRAKIMEALNPTSEQREKLKTMRLGHQKKMAQLRANLKVARLDLRAVMDVDAPTGTRVKAAVAKVNEARSRILEHRVGHRIASKGLLTPEQREKIKELKMDRPFRGKGHWRGRGRRGMGGGRGMGEGRHGFFHPEPGQDSQGQGI